MKHLLTIAAMLLLLQACTIANWQETEPVYTTTAQGDYMRFMKCVKIQHDANNPVPSALIPMIFKEYELEVEYDLEHKIAYGKFPRGTGPFRLMKAEVPFGKVKAKQIGEDQYFIEYRRGDTWAAGTNNKIMAMLKSCTA